MRIYKLTKYCIKKGEESGIPVGSQAIGKLYSLLGDEAREVTPEEVVDKLVVFGGPFNFIKTSDLVSIKDIGGYYMVETKTSIYKLEKL